MASWIAATINPPPLSGSSLMPFRKGRRYVNVAKAPAKVSRASQQPRAAARPIRRASSTPESTSTRTPVRRSTSSMNSAAFEAARTDAVSVASTRSAPRASAMERKRLTHSDARSIAAGERYPSRSVSWPSRTVSLSRARTANESADAASTTTSLMEFEPISTAASFISQPSGACSWRLYEMRVTRV